MTHTHYFISTKPIVMVRVIIAAQAQSNRWRRGRKRDFRDAERLLKRLVARYTCIYLY